MFNARGALAGGLAGMSSGAGSQFGSAMQGLMDERRRRQSLAGPVQGVAPPPGSTQDASGNTQVQPEDFYQPAVVSQPTKMMLGADGPEMVVPMQRPGMAGFAGYRRHGMV